MYLLSESWINLLDGYVSLNEIFTIQCGNGDGKTDKYCFDFTLTRDANLITIVIFPMVFYAGWAGVFSYLINPLIEYRVLNEKKKPIGNRANHTKKHYFPHYLPHYLPHHFPHYIPISTFPVNLTFITLYILKKIHSFNASPPVFPALATWLSDVLAIKVVRIVRGTLFWEAQKTTARRTQAGI